MAEGFKSEVFRIVLASPRACADLRYKDQLFAAAASASANIAEGFVRQPRAGFGTGSRCPTSLMATAN